MPPESLPDQEIEAPAVGNGRANQKWRTRTALVKTAAELLAAGQMPSISEIADAARISKATAYRYFSSSDALLLEATREGTLLLADERIAAEMARTDDVHERLDRLVNAFQDLVEQNRTTLRAVLRVALTDPSTADAVLVRNVHRFRERWLEQVLQPLQGKLDPAAMKRLMLALSLCMGTEADIVLRDIHEASAEDAKAVCHWAANAVLDEALQDAGIQRCS